MSIALFELNVVKVIIAAGFAAIIPESLAWASSSNTFKEELASKWVGNPFPPNCPNLAGYSLIGVAGVTGKKVMLAANKKTGDMRTIQGEQFNSVAINLYQHVTTPPIKS